MHPRAYEEYLRGRQQWHNWSAESFARAVEHFERALEHDPAYALAYAGLGNAYGALSYYGLMLPSEGFPRARAAALRALEIDPDLSDAHVTIGLEGLFHAWDWPASAAALDRALSVDPNSAIAHAVQSLWLITCGRFDEAMAATRKARSLDPLSPFINMGVAWVHHFAGRFEDAIREVLDILALKPGLEEAGNVLITSYERLGRFEEAAARMREQRCWGQTIDADAVLDAYRRGGREGYFQERLAQMTRNVPARPTMGYARAAVHIELGDRDAAVACLEDMVDHHVGGCVFLGVDPLLTSMRGMPRFEAVIRRVGIPHPQTV